MSVPGGSELLSSCEQEESQEECFKRQETTAALLTTCYCTPILSITL